MCHATLKHRRYIFSISKNEQRLIEFPVVAPVPYQESNSGQLSFHSPFEQFLSGCLDQYFK